MNTQTLGARSAALTASMTSQAPEGLLSAFEVEQAQLRAAGVPAGAAKPGTKVPDVALLDADGEATSLYEVADGRPAVVVTFRGAWGPYCNMALNAYEAELLPVLAERGIALIGLSPQKPEGTAATRDKNSLTFPVLSDPGNKLATELGFATTPTADALATLARLGNDVAKLNSDGTTGLPMPSVLLVDRDHVLRWIDIQPDYTARTETTDILAALDTLD
ncbi:peroxiredoxin-like family protein [Saccharothrix luteola]|uniref:peroxiredoxin-like family protein n=1 Tax=Saccharothrix luteola TaxID=2893018 RepID=UPI001E4A0E9B|nr:peroxiredoxin-like family protein [Saccharothrix luteola]MCC8245170.1 AhpC/TSA family protein [Saccharothrix luteola]